MIAEKTRQDFESYATGRGWSVEQISGFYVDMRAFDGWSIWLASRAAVKISLPSHQRIFLFRYTGQEVRDICIHELQTAGVSAYSPNLEVKP